MSVCSACFMSQFTCRRKKQDKTAVPRGPPRFLLFFWPFPLVHQDFTKWDRDFRATNSPISLDPTLVRFWKAQRISYVRVASVSADSTAWRALDLGPHKSVKRRKTAACNFVFFPNDKASLPFQHGASPTAVAPRACSQILLNRACVFSHGLWLRVRGAACGATTRGRFEPRFLACFFTPFLYSPESSPKTLP